MLGFSQHVETLHTQNLEREQTLVQFKKKIAELTDTLREREEALEELSTAAASRVNEVAADQQHAATHNAVDEENIAQLKAAATANEVAVRRATVLEMTLADKNREIEQLQQAIEQSANAAASESYKQVVDLKNLVREQELSIAQLKDQVANSGTSAQEEEIRNLREAMTEQEEIISQLRAVLDKATRQTTRKSTPRLRASPAIPIDTPRSGDLFANPSQPNGPVEDASNSIAVEPLSGRPDAKPTGVTSSSDRPSAATSESNRNSAVSIELFSQPPVNADDLKTINGIGPAFERTLNRLGIFRFEQIASLSRDDIEWVAQELNSFAERIVRDQWVAQAKALDSSNTH
ncbi:MAG: hypothetical protein HKN70_05290 [Gammaproteobacteria bacterium]|nr:hypothetical protein [Gammaproteobacteria bacterium]